MASGPAFWLDATALKAKQGGRIVGVAAIIAVAVTTDGKREIAGLRIGPSEAEPCLGRPCLAGPGQARPARHVADQLRTRRPKLGGLHGRRRDRRARHHGLPQPASNQAAQHQPAPSA